MTPDFGWYCNKENPHHLQKDDEISHFSLHVFFTLYSLHPPIALYLYLTTLHCGYLI